MNYHESMLKEQNLIISSNLGLTRNHYSLLRTTSKYVNLGVYHKICEELWNVIHANTPSLLLSELNRRKREKN